MRIDTRHVYVVDVEATCWASDEERGTQPNEVIEIGICRLEMKTGKVDEVSSYIVKPQFTTVSPFCTSLTGWTQEQIDVGGTMLATLAAIRENYRLGNDNVWFSWGEYDRVKLSSNEHERGGVLDLYGIQRQDNIFSRMKHFNAKSLMMLRERHEKGMGMARALNYYGLTLDGRHHNGADDAANIAKLVHRILT